MSISFRQLRDPMSGAISTTLILYTDEQGVIWTVPLGVGHRMDDDIYQPWLAAGNQPEPAAPLPQMPA